MHDARIRAFRNVRGGGRPTRARRMASFEAQADSPSSRDRRSLESASLSMHRSTRLRRFAVAFLVVLVLAVAARFARAASPGESIAMNDKLFLLMGAV